MGCCIPLLPHIEVGEKRIYSFKLLGDHVTSPKDCILEPVLWTNEWVCLGEASAVTDCEIQLLSADDFEEIVSASPQLKQVGQLLDENTTVTTSQYTAVGVAAATARVHLASVCLLFGAAS
eukprot:3479357-Amphidinium_carterae.1